MTAPRDGADKLTFHLLAWNTDRTREIVWGALLGEVAQMHKERQHVVGTAKRDDMTIEAGRVYQYVLTAKNADSLLLETVEVDVDVTA